MGRRQLRGTTDEAEARRKSGMGGERSSREKICPCGEPEFGEFGWFSTDADEDGVYRTYCNRCGAEVET